MALPICIAHGHICFCLFLTATVSKINYINRIFGNIGIMVIIHTYFKSGKRGIEKLPPSI
jgi:hypothetical protein